MTEQRFVSETNLPYQVAEASADRDGIVRQTFNDAGITGGPGPRWRYDETQEIGAPVTGRFRLVVGDGQIAIHRNILTANFATWLDSLEGHFLYLVGAGGNFVQYRVVGVVTPASTWRSIDVVEVVRYLRNARDGGYLFDEDEPVSFMSVLAAQQIGYDTDGVPYLI